MVPTEWKKVAPALNTIKKKKMSDQSPNRNRMWIKQYGEKNWRKTKYWHLRTTKLQGKKELMEEEQIKIIIRTKLYNTVL